MSPHGTNGRYVNGPCRCGPCREAARLYQRQLRAVHLAKLLANPNDYRHGSEYGYRCGCRCHRCATAKRAHTAASTPRKASA